MMKSLVALMVGAFLLGGGSGTAASAAVSYAGDGSGHCSSCPKEV